MSLWSTREKALLALAGSLREEASALLEAFTLVDDCIHQMLALDTQLSRVSALTAVKSRNLALGCYGLCLDGLAQEAGALFRPLIETIELMAYLRLDPARVEEALAGQLPSAGIIARRIEGNFKDVREYLNEHASHYSFSAESMKHLVDFSKGTFELRVIQPHSDPVLKKNLHTLLAIYFRVVVESLMILGAEGQGVDPDLINRGQELRERFGTIVGLIPPNGDAV